MTSRLGSVKRFACVFAILGIALFASACSEQEQGQGGVSTPPPPVARAVSVYQHGQVLRSWRVDEIKGADSGLIWFNYADNKRTIVSGDFVYEPIEHVAAPATYKPTHRIRFLEDGKEVRSWLVSGISGADKGMIWFDDPGTGKRVIVHGTFTYEPMDSPIAMGHYKADHQILLYQDGQVTQFWHVRGNDTSSNNSLIWFDDDYTKLRVIISGTFVFSPIE